MQAEERKSCRPYQAKLFMLVENWLQYGLKKGTTELVLKLNSQDFLLTEVLIGLEVFLSVVWLEDG